MANETKVTLSGDDFSGDTLRALESNPDLQQLVIWGGELSNDRLAPLSRLIRLQGLVLGEMPIDDGIFQYLKPLRELSYLNLAYTDIEGNFTLLAGLALRDVRLEGCRRVGDRCAQALAAFPTLRHLEIHMTGLTDDGVHHLAECRLEELWLGGRITDRGMNVVGAMKSLKHLDVCAQGVTDEGVRAISGLTGLEVLWLSDCRITDASIEPLSHFRSLRELAIGNTGISAAGKARLQAALPGCRIVTDRAANV